MSMRNRYLPILVFSLLSSLIGCSENSFSGAPENLSRSYGILGGQDVVGSDPVARSTVMLLNLETNEICTGTAVSDQALVTAAHCVPQEKENLQIFLAVNPLDEKSDVETSAISKIVVHSDYNAAEPMKSVDLAILHLREKLPISYQAVSVAKASAFKVGQDILLAGYGNNSSQEIEGFGRLRQVRASVSEIAGSFFEVDQSLGKGICDGDSGGPVFVVEGETLTLLGVSKLVYDKKQTGADNCLTTAQFVSVGQESIQQWILKSLLQNTQQH